MFSGRSILLAAILYHLLLLCVSGIDGQSAPSGWWCSSYLDTGNSPIPEPPGVQAYYDLLTIGFDVGPTTGVATIVVDLFGQVSDPQTGQTLYRGPLSPTVVTLNYAWLYGYSALELSEGSAYACVDEPWPPSYEFSCCPQCPMGLATWLTGTFPVTYDELAGTMVITGWPWWLGQSNVVLKGVGSGPASIVYPSCVAVTLPPIPTCVAPTTVPPPTTPAPTTPAPTTTPPPTTTAAPACAFVTAPGSMAFYEQFVQCSTLQAFVWENTGGVTYTGFNYTITGNSAGNWVLSPGLWTCTGSVAPSGTCDLQVQFCLQANLGTYSASGTVQICANCSGSAVCSTIGWTAHNPASTTTPPPTTTPAPTTPAPTTTAPATTTPVPTTTPPPSTLPSCVGDYTFVPTSWDYGTIQEGTCSPYLDFTFQCGNDANVWSLFSATITNGNSVADYIIQAYQASPAISTCFAPGFTCTAAASCTISVALCPSHVGLLTATLSAQGLCGGGYINLFARPLSGTGSLFLAAESMRVRRASHGLPGVYPEPTCVPQPSTVTLATSTASASTSTASSSTSAASTFTTTAAATTATTSSASTSLAASTTTRAIAASTSIASATSSHATATTSLASTTAAVTTSVSAGATTSTTGITTAVSAMTTSGATATTSFSTSTGAVLPPAFPNEQPTPSPYLETCQVIWMVPKPLTEGEPWYDQTAVWPTFDFAHPVSVPVEYVFGSVNLINLVYNRNFDHPELDYCGAPLTGTSRDQSLTETQIYGVYPQIFESGGAFYAPGTNGFAQYTITSAANSVYNNCPYNGFLTNFDYGLADYCTIGLAFDPGLCTQQQPSHASGYCQSYACHQVDVGPLTPGNWHWDCVLLLGSFINKPGATEPGIFPFEVQRNATEPWAKRHMSDFTESLRRKLFLRPLARAGDQDALRKLMLSMK